jgi:hypothetical protein
MKQIYTVWANDDNIEGRGRDVIVYICSNQDTAIGLSKKLGPMGCSDGYVKEAWLLDSISDLNEVYRVKTIRENALKKLSEEEKKVLGLK